MATSTDPSVLAAQAICFNQCIPPGHQTAVQTYLLAVLAGFDTSQAGASALAAQAVCFVQCVPPGEQLAVQNYLLTQLLS